MLVLVNKTSADWGGAVGVAILDPSSSVAVLCAGTCGLGALVACTSELIVVQFCVPRSKKSAAQLPVTGPLQRTFCFLHFALSSLLGL